MPSREHLLAVVTGYGLRVLPRAPCRVLLGADPRDLDVHHDSEAGPRFARLCADGRGGYTSKVDQNATSPLEVVDIHPGPARGAWELETGRFRAAFPKGYALHSVPVMSPSPFDLVGPDGSRISVQSPLRMPALEEMVGSGEQIVTLGKDCIDLACERDGRPYTQRHHVVDQLAFTAQAPAAATGAVRAALQSILESLVLT